MNVFALLESGKTGPIVILRNSEDAKDCFLPRDAVLTSRGRVKDDGEYVMGEIVATWRSEMTGCLYSLVCYRLF